MAQVAQLKRWTIEEYLDFEQRSQVRHEYVGGMVFAMTGASLAHGRIVRNLTVALDRHLRGGPCEVIATDLRVRIDAANAFYYPDLLVLCDERNQRSQQISNPVLLIEVLSPSTETVDRREKRLNYLTLPSLREYVLVAQDQPAVEVDRRTDTGWVVETASGADTVELQSIGLRLPLSEIYRDIAFE
jgi:Uma2 family endonuclease